MEEKLPTFFDNSLDDSCLLISKFAAFGFTRSSVRVCKLAFVPTRALCCDVQLRQQYTRSTGMPAVCDLFRAAHSGVFAQGQATTIPYVASSFYPESQNSGSSHRGLPKHPKTKDFMGSWHKDRRVRMDQQVGTPVRKNREREHTKRHDRTVVVCQNPDSYGNANIDSVTFIEAKELRGRADEKADA